MMDLPTGFPMYCIDLKQELDNIPIQFYYGTYPHQEVGTNWKQHPNYPNQENEHNALYDAKWNKKLYEFINSIK